MGDKMKILQIGCGGIGSILVQEVKECVEQHQIDSMIDYTIVDDDIVELNQISYQNFLPKEAGISKSNALANRLKPFDVKWFNANKKRIVENKQLEGFNIIILCVDNDATRKLVVDYCFKNNKEFLDLRATGRNIMAIPRMDDIRDNLKFIDIIDTKTYSCQDKEDLEKGYINKGHKIIAYWGIQMLLNILRGRKNRMFTGVV